MKFRLTVGRHIKDGRTLEKGAVVESDSDLTKIFPLKFERVTVPVEESKTTTAKPEFSDDEDDEKPTRAPQVPQQAGGVKKPAAPAAAVTAKVKGK